MASGITTTSCEDRASDASISVTHWNLSATSVSDGSYRSLHRQYRTTASTEQSHEIQCVCHGLGNSIPESSHLSTNINVSSKIETYSHPCRIKQAATSMPDFSSQTGLGRISTTAEVSTSLRRRRLLRSSLKLTKDKDGSLCGILGRKITIHAHRVSRL